MWLYPLPKQREISNFFRERISQPSPKAKQSRMLAKQSKKLASFSSKSAEKKTQNKAWLLGKNPLDYTYDKNNTKPKFHPMVEHSRWRQTCRQHSQSRKSLASCKETCQAKSTHPLPQVRWYKKKSIYSSRSCKPWLIKELKQSASAECLRLSKSLRLP